MSKRLTILLSGALLLPVARPPLAAQDTAGPPAAIVVKL